MMPIYMSLHKLKEAHGDNEYDKQYLNYGYSELVDGEVVEG